MPRGRPKKKDTKRYDSSDLFKLVAEIAGRDLTDEESSCLCQASIAFIQETYSPLQIFDEDVLKEAITGREDDDDPEDDGYDKDEMDSWMKENYHADND